MGETEPGEIFEALKKLHAMAHEKGAKTIAITIPGEWQSFFVLKKRFVQPQLWSITLRTVVGSERRTYRSYKEGG